MLCSGNYDWFWEAMKRVGLLNHDDNHGKGCIYTNYFGTLQERESVRFAIEEDMSRNDARPFLIYPEGCVTTGVSAVMQYQKFVFGLGKVIVPVCLSIYNPWPYEHYTLTAGAKTHLLWYLFSPFVIFKHTLLKPQKLRPNEKPEEFSQRVQIMTAAHLNLGVIKMNWKQKERLSQALGFIPFQEEFWSRRRSMIKFRENLFRRQVILKDGGAVVDIESGQAAMEEEEKAAVFLAKEVAMRQNASRDDELVIFDNAMQTAAEISKQAGSKRRDSVILQECNERMVKEINELRVKKKEKGLETDTTELKTYFEDASTRKQQVRQKRRASLVAMEQEELAKKAALEAEGKIEVARVF